MMRRRMSGRWRSHLLLLALFAVVGCGGSRFYPVHGKVLYKDDNSPFPGGLVVLEPADEEMPRVGPRGEIQPDGSFLIGTNSNDDGAPEGTYRAQIVPPPPTGSRARPDRRLLDPKYTEFARSGFEITVKKERNEVILYVERPADPVIPPPPPPPDQ